MKKLARVFLGLAVTIWLSNAAFAEHPGTPVKTEHPGKTSAEEHPGKKEMLSANEIIKGIKDHINKVTEENGGVYPLNDTQEGKDLKLKLAMVHEDKVSYITKDDAYFACTDFITDDGLTKYDVDFWMKKNPEGKLEVYQAKIHKKDGSPRFTYKDDEICPIK